MLASEVLLQVALGPALRPCSRAACKVTEWWVVKRNVGAEHVLVPAVQQQVALLAECSVHIGIYSFD